MADLGEEVGEEITHFIVSDDGETYCGAAEGVFNGEVGAAGASACQMARCPVIA